jgi:GntR family transcriptional regulator, transcriptional repressor for pyruvate dehydrogenase complex
MSATDRVDRASALRPLLAETAAARIADRFVTAFALGQFVVGQRLPSLAELASTLEVSQTTVRQAIARLNALGYVEVRRGRTGGTFVLQQWGPSSDAMVRRALGDSWGTLQEAVDCRAIVEQAIARVAAERVTEADAPRIRAAVDAYERAADRDASRLADTELHQAIAAAAHNAQLGELSLSLRQYVTLGFPSEPYTPATRATAIEQHRQLAEAVLEHRAEDAARIARAHFGLTEHLLRDLHDRTTTDPSTPGA